MIRRLREWLHRGEMPDPVDDHYATATAILAPDPGRCDCPEHTDPCPLTPPTEET